MDINDIGYRVGQSESGDAFILIEPQEKEHDTETHDCWCNPTICVLCSECDRSDDGCWACDGGLKTITRAEAAFATAPFVIIHNFQ